MLASTKLTVIVFLALGILLTVSYIHAAALDPIEEPGAADPSLESVVSLPSSPDKSTPQCNFDQPECQANGDCFCNTMEGELLQFDVTFYWNPPDPERPICTWAFTLPPGAQYPTQQGIGEVTSTFMWTPSSNHAGEYLVEFHGGQECFASQGVLPVRITVTEPPVTEPMCGDINGDGVRDIVDVVGIVNVAFRGGAPPNPPWVADINGDGIVSNILDVIGLINHAFRGGPEPTCGIVDHEDYFNTFYATCQVGDVPPEGVFYTTELSYISGRLIINDNFAYPQDLILQRDPMQLRLIPTSAVGAAILPNLPRFNLSIFANWTIAINDSGIVPANGSRSNVTDDTIVYYTKNTTIVRQRDGHPFGNTSCGPASGAALLDQINRTLNGSLRHPGTNSTINIMRNLTAVNANGTSVWGIVSALARFLNQSGLSGNYTIKYYGNYTYANGSPWNGSTVVAGTNITWRHDTNITWQDYIRELFLTEEHVILRLVRTSDRQGHFVTGDDLRLRGDVGTGMFRRFISFMDPWDGNIKEVELTGNCIQLWGTEWCIKDMISVSPV